MPLFLSRLVTDGRLVCSPEAMQLLMRSSWPGNVEQLWQVLRQHRAAPAQRRDPARRPAARVPHGQPPAAQPAGVDGARRDRPQPAGLGRQQDQGGGGRWACRGPRSTARSTSTASSRPPNRAVWRHDRRLHDFSRWDGWVRRPGWPGMASWKLGSVISLTAGAAGSAGRVRGWPTGGSLLARLRTLLVALAMGAGSPVSVDRLAAALWDGDGRRSLRRACRPIDPAAERAGCRVDRDGGGGVSAAGRSGAGRCAAVHAAAGPCRAGVRSGDRADRLEAALVLWRGSPLDDVRSGWLDGLRAALVERYLAAVERRVDLDLAEGRHARVSCCCGT